MEKTKFEQLISTLDSLIEEFNKQNIKIRPENDNKEHSIKVWDDINPNDDFIINYVIEEINLNKNKILRCAPTRLINYLEMVKNKLRNCEKLDGYIKFLLFQIPQFSQDNDTSKFISYQNLINVTIDDFFLVNLFKFYFHFHLFL